MSTDFLKELIGLAAAFISLIGAIISIKAVRQESTATSQGLPSSSSQSNSSPKDTIGHYFGFLLGATSAIVFSGSVFYVLVKSGLLPPDFFTQPIELIIWFIRY